MFKSYCVFSLLNVIWEAGFGTDHTMLYRFTATCGDSRLLAMTADAITPFPLAISWSVFIDQHIIRMCACALMFCV